MLSAGPLVLQWGSAPAWAQTTDLDPPPSCISADPTPAQTDGPYYRTGSPERRSLIEFDQSGTRLLLSGYVVGLDCQAIPGAWLDFWQADASGRYDNAGYRLRGQQYADSSGHYQLETILPGEYPGRTPHIHVKVRAPGGPVLTTQLYFPDQPSNNRDGIFNAALLLPLQDDPAGKRARFDFVLTQS
jgi:protocatechuate 3,4-dioxygenase beta subunit